MDETQRRRELYREATSAKTLTTDEKERRARTWHLHQLFSDWMWHFDSAGMNSIDFGRAAYMAGYEQAALEGKEESSTAADIAYMLNLVERLMWRYNEATDTVLHNPAYWSCRFCGYKKPSHAEKCIARAALAEASNVDKQGD